MKKIVLLFAINLASIAAFSQPDQQLQSLVEKLDKAASVKDYQELATSFASIAPKEKMQWLSYYYAAFCNAKVGWLKQEDDPDNIESFATKALEESNKAKSLLDPASQKKELSEVYCILSMGNRAMVFISPMSNGRKYGPLAAQYTSLAVQANPDNPRAIYLDGWQKYMTPKLWGGDKAKAKELLLKAKQLLGTQDPEMSYPHWGKKEVDELLAKKY